MRELFRSKIFILLLAVLVVLGVSVIMAAILALLMRVALRFMSPTSENTSMLFLALVAAGTAVAAHMGGSAPLAALLGGMLLKQLNPRPWAWPRQLGNASSLLTMLMFVLVSTVAAQASWSGAVALAVLARDAALSAPAHAGQMGAARYFFHYELPRIGANRPQIAAMLDHQLDRLSQQPFEQVRHLGDDVRQLQQLRHWPC